MGSVEQAAIVSRNEKIDRLVYEKKELVRQRDDAREEIVRERERAERAEARIELLRNVLLDARDKLKIYYDLGDKSYSGGVPYNVLVSQINGLVEQLAK